MSLDKPREGSATSNSTRITLASATLQCLTAMFPAPHLDLFALFMSTSGQTLIGSEKSMRSTEMTVVLRCPYA